MKAVGVMAPAVKQTLKSLVNPDMHFDGVHDFPSPTFYRQHAADFFREKLLAHVDLHLVGSNKVSLDCLHLFSMCCEACQEHASLGKQCLGLLL